MIRLSDLNPLRLLHRTSFSYQRLPLSAGADPQHGSPLGSSQRRPWQWPSSSQRGMDGLRCCARMSVMKFIALGIAFMVCISLWAGGGYYTARHKAAAKVAANEDKPLPYYWMHYKSLEGYYNGLRTLVPFSEYTPGNRYNLSDPPEQLTQTLRAEPALDPVPFVPYPDYDSSKYTKDYQPVERCYLDPADAVAPPDVYAYPGLPADLPDPYFGSYGEFGFREDMCFDRFGRFGPYGYGGDKSHGGMGVGLQSEHAGSEKVLDKVRHIDYSGVDWGAAQKRCAEKNKGRFVEGQSGGRKRVEKHAFVLRTWTGYEYSEHQMLTLRAMVSELALRSGAEYEVHFLVHVKNNSIPIWADEGLYNRTLQENVPREFWNMSTLWSEQQMMSYYPDPFPGNFANMASTGVHGVYRSPHFALQWFSQQHPEYDFIWNWEMDLRYTGHYYDFASKIGAWAKRQPRKGLWERSQRFWFPQFHGDYANFTRYVEGEIDHAAAGMSADDAAIHGPVPIWGPVRDFPHADMLAPPPECSPPHAYAADDYSWGVGEDADLLVFDPLFDPSRTNWAFRADVTGYDLTLPIPPRRSAIVTASRLSRRLLDTMHREVWERRHTMFPEMWAPSVCLHHGLKAAYVPHPVHFNHDWDMTYMDGVFNHPVQDEASPFGFGEHNLFGSTFYYDATFSAALWRRWLGQMEAGKGGRKQEEEGTGRMCLRPILHHPIKHEHSPFE